MSVAGKVGAPTFGGQRIASDQQSIAMMEAADRGIRHFIIAAYYNTTTGTVAKRIKRAREGCNWTKKPRRRRYEL